MDNLYYKEEAIASIETDELGYGLVRFLGGDLEAEDLPVLVDILDEGPGLTTTTPIEINKLIEFLTGIREAGANFVSIDYHVDHDTYLIDTFKMVKASSKEIQAFVQEQEEERQTRIEAKKEELKRRLQTLEEASQ